MDSGRLILKRYLKYNIFNYNATKELKFLIRCKLQQDKGDSFIINVTHDTQIDS